MRTLYRVADVCLRPPAGSDFDQPAFEATSLLFVTRTVDRSHQRELGCLNHVFHLSFRQPCASDRVEDELPVGSKAYQPTLGILGAFEPRQEAGGRRD